MNLWYEAADELEKVERTVNPENFNIDQKLKVAEIKALLAIGQELNGLRLKDDKPFD